MPSAGPASKIALLLYAVARTLLSPRDGSCLSDAQSIYLCTDPSAVGPSSTHPFHKPSYLVERPCVVETTLPDLVHCALRGRLVWARRVGTDGQHGAAAHALLAGREKRREIGPLGVGIVRRDLPGAASRTRRTLAVPPGPTDSPRLGCSRGSTGRRRDINMHCHVTDVERCRMCQRKEVMRTSLQA